MDVARLAETAKFVARTYRTSHRMKTRVITPREAGRLIAEDVARTSPLYVKLAQFVSSRKDIVDADFAEALSVVQDSVESHDPPPEVPGFVIERRLASASIADVYLAHAVGKKSKVVVKRRRPGVNEQIRRDLPLLTSTMRVCTALNLPAARNILDVVREASPVLLDELDFRVEAANQRKFRKAFREVPWLVIPRIISSSEDMLVCSYEQAKKVSKVHVPNADLARRLATLYGLMLRAGIMHVDMHAGNFGIRPSGKIVLYDFGAVLHFDATIATQATSLMKAIVLKNAADVVSSLEKIGVIVVSPGQRVAIRRLVRRMFDTDMHKELEKSSAFVDSGRGVVRFSTSFVYMARTLALVQGTCRSLDPDFKFQEGDFVDDSDTDISITGFVGGMARDVAAMPSAVQTLQNDVEELQERIVNELDGGKDAVSRAAFISAVVAIVVFLLR